uniref:PHD-type domain-containing protein n=1 Tax=Mycena chlorophos TaxID=658473 RepID=A0ABQ0LTL4_MYCCL|nr:predicted protein [Mycena chlorophos]
MASTAPCRKCKSSASGGRNYLLECIKCSRWYHQLCHYPQITDVEVQNVFNELLRNKNLLKPPWVCRRCKSSKADGSFGQPIFIDTEPPRPLRASPVIDLTGSSSSDVIELLDEDDDDIVVDRPRTNLHERRNPAPPVSLDLTRDSPGIQERPISRMASASPLFTELGLTQETPSMSRTSSPIPTERGLFSATPSISRTASPLPTELGIEDMQTPAPATPRNVLGMEIEEEEQKPLILGLQKLAIASNTRSGTHTPVGGSLGPAWIKQRALNVHWFQDVKPKIGAENPVVRKPKHTSRCESTESFALFHYHVFDPEST